MSDYTLGIWCVLVFIACIGAFAKRSFRVPVFTPRVPV